MALSDLDQLPEPLKRALSHLAHTLMETWPAPGRCMTCQALVTAETVLKKAQRHHNTEERSKEGEDT